ncbi:MAG: PadR family transcriptional regulator [Acidimicrobiales bacterium]
MYARRIGVARKDPGLYIMVALAEGPLHGYAMRKAIAEFAGVELGPGSLYGALSRLEDLGYVVALDSDNPRRRPYRLTALGADALRSEIREMEVLSSELRRRAPSLLSSN